MLVSAKEGRGGRRLEVSAVRTPKNSSSSVCKQQLRWRSLWKEFRESINKSLKERVSKKHSYPVDSGE